MRILSAAVIAVFIFGSSGAFSEEAVLPAAPELKCFQSEEQAEAAESDPDVFVGERFWEVDEEGGLLNIEQWCAAILSAGEKISWRDSGKGITFILGYRQEKLTSFLDVTATKNGRSRSISFAINEWNENRERRSYNINKRAYAKLFFEEEDSGPSLLFFHLELRNIQPLYPADEQVQPPGHYPYVI